MTYSGNRASVRKAVEIAISDLVASHAAGEDPRRTIARLNACLIDCQRAGLDMPLGYMRLSQRLAADCVAQSRAA